MNDRVEIAVRALVEALRAELLDAKPANDSPTLVTVAAYASAHAISESTVRNAIRENRLASTRFGRAVRIAPDAVIRPKQVTVATARADLRLLGGGKVR